jgi:hypothetical protein
MSAIKVMQQLAYDWGVRCFGVGHMSNPAIRALRCGEEAVELMQCYGISREVMHKLVDTVCDRPFGDPVQEIGGVLLTTSVLCQGLGTTIEDMFEMELRRCLSKSTDHFEKRNDEKIKLGLTA